MPLGAIHRMAMVGRYERLGAQRAFDLGMIDEVIDPPEKLQEAAQALAETIARNSPSALMTTKRAIWAAMETGRTAALDEGMGYVRSFWGHPDNVEGPRAFSEKRDADWAPPTRTF
jgi:enoyl-CoA hydratase